MAPLLVPPLAIFFLGGLRRLGGKETLRRLIPWILGAAVFPAATVLILIRSGWPAWEWSGYGYWTPPALRPPAETFNLRYAFTPDLAFLRKFKAGRISHLELAVRVLLGVPGLRMHHDLRPPLADSGMARRLTALAGARNAAS